MTREELRALGVPEEKIDDVLKLRGNEIIDEQNLKKELEIKEYDC